MMVNDRNALAAIDAWWNETIIPYAREITPADLERAQAL